MPSASARNALIEPADVYPEAASRAPFTVLDLRAPVEVARGSLPGAVNLPILDDAERHLVGLRYKEAGQDQAVALGYELTGQVMPDRVRAWRELAERGPIALACWRGGMRSRLAQSFLGEPLVPRVEGGYRALRAHLTSSLPRSLGARRKLVLSGMTGTGKTDLLTALAGSPRLHALDLEALAGHRGSSFGAVGAQPAQQSFENALAAELLRGAASALLVEDESRRIGALHLPDPIFEAISGAPLLILEAPWQERIERIHRQYIVETVSRLGPGPARAELAAATERLRRRLGGALVERLEGVLEEVWRSQAWNDWEALEPFIAPLLAEYYDPLYRRAMTTLSRPVLARGDREELTSWLRMNL